MGEIVNLRRTRKAKVRGEAEARAAANRAKHGANKSAREQYRARIQKLERDVAAHKLERD